MKLMLLPDYLFYCFAKWFYKGDGPFGSRAIIIVAILFTAVYCALSYLLFSLVIGNTVATDKILNAHQRIWFGYIMAAWVTIAFFTFKHYKSKFAFLSAKWDNENAWSKRLKNVIAITAFFSILYSCYAIFAKLYF